jgi:transcriptional regulator with XRE-family HTH domain
MADNSVLRVNPVEEQADYRRAVADILLAIQQERGVTHIEIAEKIGVSLGTISNAANKKSDLCSIYLKRLGQAYGGHHLNPYLALFGVRAEPLEAGNEADVLPFVAKVNLKIAEARSPGSKGGPRETHCEKLGYLPDLKELQREISALICKIEGLAA